MSETENGPKGLFDRRPWMGAVAFALIAVIVGAVLVIVVEIRPHYRGEGWKLITELPPAGTGMDGGPARCLIPEEFRRDPIRVVVLANVVDDLDRNCGHHEVLLAASNRTRLLSWGVTEPRGGSLHLAVPTRFDSELFAGDVEALCLLPGVPPISVVVPPPKKGRTAVTLRVPPSRSVDIAIRRADGTSFTGEAQVLVSALGAEPNPLSMGYRVVGGATRIGGLPDDLELSFRVRAKGFSEGKQRLRFPAQASDYPQQELFLGPKQAELRALLLDDQGHPLREAPVVLRPRFYGRENITTTTDGEGHVRIALEAWSKPPTNFTGVFAYLSAEENAVTLGVSVERPHVLPGEVWNAGELRLQREWKRIPNIRSPGRGSLTVKPEGESITVQYPDGLPASEALVEALESRLPLPWPRWAPTTAGTNRAGKTKVMLPASAERCVLVASTDNMFGYLESPKFPAFIGVKPLGQAHVKINGLTPFAKRPWQYVELVPKKVSAPAVVVAALAPKPVAISRLDRCRITRLLPGVWTAQLKSFARDADTTETTSLLGEITVPATGRAVHVTFDT